MQPAPSRSTIISGNPKFKLNNNELRKVNSVSINLGVETAAFRFSLGGGRYMADRIKIYTPSLLTLSFSGK